MNWNLAQMFESGTIWRYQKLVWNNLNFFLSNLEEKKFDFDFFKLSFFWNPKEKTVLDGILVNKRTVLKEECLYILFLTYFEICRLVKCFTSRKEASFAPSLTGWQNSYWVRNSMYLAWLMYSREQKHVSINDTPMLLIEINSISNIGCQR